MSLIPNILWSNGLVTLSKREALVGQKGCVVWLTGLPGSGKSTIASLLEDFLISNGRLAIVLDGDNLRHGLCRDLTFSEMDRHENIRRASEVAKLFADSGLITITSFISPYQKDRNLARTTIGTHRFFETYMSTPSSVCEARDPKGHWKKARAGDIKDFTGIDAPFEIPEKGEIILDTIQLTPSACVAHIVKCISSFIDRTASS